MIKVLLDQNILSKVESWLQGEVGETAQIFSTRNLGMSRFNDIDIFYYCQKNEMVIVDL